MTEKLKVHVAIPTSGMCRSAFAYSLAQLMAAAPQMLNDYRQDAEVEVSIGMMETSVIHVNREKLANQAVEAKCSHLLFIDDDMSFDPRAVAIMLSRRQPFVGCNYPMRGWPVTFTAVGTDGHTRIVTRKESKGLEEVQYTGFGLCLIEMRVFENTPKPWFWPLYLAEIDMYTTEDNPFCLRIQKAGFRCFVDHDASKLVEHHGTHRFRWDQWRPEPPKDEKPSAEVVELKQGNKA